MIAAVLEWFLWIAAFLYCLVKVFIKAEHWSIRVLSVIVGFFFTAMRYACHPGVVSLAGRPLPSGPKSECWLTMRGLIQMHLPPYNDRNLTAT